MEDVKLRNLSIACSVLGIILIFYASSFLGAQVLEISSITLDNTGTLTKVCGIVSNYRNSKGHVFLDVADSTGLIKAVAFNNTAISLKTGGTNLYTLENGRGICVSGEVSEYPKGSGNLEIIIKTAEVE